MSELVWIHRFNGNELGLGARGGFCLVPVEARKIFFPDRDFVANPDIKETVKLTYLDVQETVELHYGKPPSKTEHRLSFTGDTLKKYIGDENSSSLIKPGKVGCFFRKENEIFLSVVDPESAYGRLLEQFPTRGKTTNVVTETVINQEAQLLQTGLVHTATLSKPFLLLAGISGTGKTRFVRKQVEATGSLNETYCLTSVRPDWHEPSDLLGYVSRLSKDGQAEYITTDVLQFIAKAWRGIFDSGLSVQVNSNEQRGECLVVTGDSQTQQKVRPYWLCLDEMNLAPVEQYFADYLSVLETRSWSWDNDQFTYSSDPLLKPLALGLADENGDTDEVYDRKLRSSLGFDDDKYDELWQLFCQYGLGIPFNLIVAGTVNMDETTHGFSRKVIDRALSIDFGEFFPNDIDEFFEAKKQPLTLGYPIYSQAKLDLFSQVEADSTAEKTKEFFLSVNAVLKGTAFELAYRAFNELCLSVISFSPKDEDELAAVFDDFLMCKILPRVEGDEDKLTTEDGGALLEKLVEVLSNQSTLKAIWDGERADLLRQNIEDKDTPIKVSCRSKIKLEYMQSKLQSGFTSFWP
ncbi:McrB family protein [Vibrio sp. 10N.286.46.E10]|uniref:McrB family protein n=1 Tax=Vibrio sp. 10N.286.46.E10 TaxID=1884477 RepID=UPI000CBC9E57|nr:restriction endonuclease [Vibrio sp. 10N.286.46.E10]PMI19670.1 hypothetical protein BCU50_02230 [Vibrio sp. 10N.286.46.E10]